MTALLEQQRAKLLEHVRVRQKQRDALSNTYRVDLGDLFVWLERLPANYADLFILDVPYASLEKWRAQGTTTRLTKSGGSSNEWFPVIENATFTRLFAELYRVQKKHSHLYFMCDTDTAYFARFIGEAAGYHFWKDIVWDKMKIGMGYHWRGRVEKILFFEKGERRLLDNSTPDFWDDDVLKVQRLKGKAYWPTEKPVEVYRKLVNASSRPGELVLDPTCGNGGAGYAAVEAGRRFHGNDIHPEAVARSLANCAEALTARFPRLPEEVSHGQ